MEAGVVRDIATLVVPRIGSVVDSTDGRVPFRVVDAAGLDVPPVSEFLREMAACDASLVTLRSDSYELLGWAAVPVSGRGHLGPGGAGGGTGLRVVAGAGAQAGAAAPIGHACTGHGQRGHGKSYPGDTYAVATRRHARTVVHAFYEYHRTVHGSPLLNPFPATRHGGDGQINVHHNPMRPWLRPSGPALYQPKAPRRIFPGDPGRAVQRGVRRAGFGPGPGAAGVLDLDRGPGQRIA